MPNVFIISDSHFDHANMLNFLNSDGTKVRPEFQNVEEMNEGMIDRWNSVVKPGDKVYHLGDFSISKKGIRIAERLNGRKTLICGNHDIFDTKEYIKYFKNVRAVKVLDINVFTHIPIHPDNFARFTLNVHGHTHSNVMKDPRYMNVCVEKINYTPVEFSEIQQVALKLRR